MTILKCIYGVCVNVNVHLGILFFRKRAIFKKNDFKPHKYRQSALLYSQ